MGMCDAWFVADSSRPRRSIERTQDMHNGSSARYGATNGVNKARCPRSSTPITEPHRALRNAWLVLVSRGRTLTRKERPRGDGVNELRREKWEKAQNPVQSVRFGLARCRHHALICRQRVASCPCFHKAGRAKGGGRRRESDAGSSLLEYRCHCPLLSLVSIHGRKVVIRPS